MEVLCARVSSHTAHSLVQTCCSAFVLQPSHPSCQVRLHPGGIRMQDEHHPLAEYPFSMGRHTTLGCGVSVCPRGWAMGDTFGAPQAWLGGNGVGVMESAAYSTSSCRTMRLCSPPAWFQLLVLGFVASVSADLPGRALLIELHEQEAKIVSDWSHNHKGVSERP